MEKAKARVHYLDYLRLIATVAVVLLHAVSESFDAVPVASFEWAVFNVFDGAVRFAVPLFVMISGALFLDVRRPLNIKTLYFKNIGRLLTAFIFWTALYTLMQFFSGMPFVDALLAFNRHSYHLWFILMIIGLYVLVPILRRITESQTVTAYFLLVGGVVNFAVPWLLNVVHMLNVPGADALQKLSTYFIGNLDIQLTAGFAYYFVLGHCLAHHEISRTWRRIVYVLGVLGVIATIGLTALYSRRIGTPNTYFYSYLTVNVGATATALFLFGKQVLSRFTPRGSWVSHLSKYSFGVYLVHILVLDKMNDWLGFSALSFNPLLSVPLLALSVLGVSLLISALLHCSPFVKNYFV